MRDETTDRIVRQFQSESDAVREAPEPVVLRATTLALAALILASFVLAGFSQVDRVVTTERGKIVPVAGARLSQALDAAIIKTLEVKEGDVVAKGQLLATLDPTFTGADLDQLQEQLVGADAQIARAEAEEQKRDFERPGGLSALARRYYDLQGRLFAQRAAQYAAQVNSYAEKIDQLSGTVRRLEGDLARFKERETISGEIERMRTQLLEKQAGSYLNVLIANDARLELLRTTESSRGALVEARHQLASLVSDRDAFSQQWYAAVSQERAQAMNARSATQAALTKAERRQSLVRMEALDDSVVLTRARVSVGSVLKEGDTLFSLVPLNSALEAEVQIAARNIGFVRAGDAATIKVDAFRHTEHGHAEGRVSWISEGAFTSDEEGRPVEAYYRARIAVTKMAFTRVPESFRLIPGMTVVSDVHVGTRSVMAYLLGGALRGVSESMREP